MKVRVTIEVDEADRQIIGLKQTGEYSQATREQVQYEIEHAFDIHMHEPREAYAETSERIKEAILKSLGQ